MYENTFEERLYNAILFGVYQASCQFGIFQSEKIINKTNNQTFKHYYG